jgi:hypothetical protein
LSIIQKVRKYGNATPRLEPAGRQICAFVAKISLFGVDSMLEYWNVWISSEKKSFFIWTTYNLQLMQINYAISKKYFILQIVISLNLIS